MPETTVPNFPLGGLSEGLNATVALDAMRAGKLKLDDRLASGATVGEFLSHQKEVPNGNKQLVELIAKNGGGSLRQIADRRIMTPVGMHKTVADSATGMWMSNVDEMYRWDLGLNATKAMTEEGSVNLFAAGLGWRIEKYNGLTRQSEYGTPAGKRNAYVRFPEKRAAIIILTGSDNVDAKLLADKIAAKLFPAQ
jgi:CubicO group peptidase (beta-lactamase class C family)